MGKDFGTKQNVIVRDEEIMAYTAPRPIIFEQGTKQNVVTVINEKIRVMPVACLSESFWASE